VEFMKQGIIHIRHATPRDNKLLAVIGAETFSDSFAAENTPENMAAYLSASFSAEKQGKELADPRARFLIAEVSGEVVGYAHLRFSAAQPVVDTQNAMEIVRFYARKNWLGKGVGPQLMRACLTEARAAGCHVVWLSVWKKNDRAIRFYRKWGFAAVGSQEFQLGDDVQRDVVMSRDLMDNEPPKTVSTRTVPTRKTRHSEKGPTLSMIRNAQEADYPYLIKRLNEWWGGRNMADMLPRLFFIHFQDSSFVYLYSPRIIGFVVGFVSNVQRETGYIHFVGVDPDYRCRNIARSLYEKFIAHCWGKNVSSIKCVTSPANTASIAFHHSMGFKASSYDAQGNPLPVPDYDGPGQDRIVFTLQIRT